MAATAHFPDSLTALQERLPDSWATRDADSLIYAILTVFADLVDELSVAAEQVYADCFLESASREALVGEWAPLLGAAGEDAPFTTEQLRDYLTEVALADSSTEALRSQLLAILAADPNLLDPVEFPGDASGITLSADGIVLGSGDELPADVSFPPDGSGLSFPDDASGVPFPTTSWVEVVERATDYAFDVYVRNYLAFDRPAFARAVARFRRAGLFAPTVTETSTPHA